jgi:CheY-like chemotaxis protein
VERQVISQGQDSGRHVLVVEDDSDLREVIADILRWEGIPVVVAQDGREALDHLTTHPQKPFLILLDLMMPRMNGWQLLEHMDRDPALASLPVCIVSASGHGKTRGRQLLRKPFQLEALLDVVARHHR